MYKRPEINSYFLLFGHLQIWGRLIRCGLRNKYRFNFHHQNLLNKKYFPKYQNRYDLKRANIQKFIIPFCGQHTSGMRHIEDDLRTKSDANHGNIYTEELAPINRKIKFHHAHAQQQKRKYKIEFACRKIEHVPPPARAGAGKEQISHYPSRNIKSSNCYKRETKLIQFIAKHMVASDQFGNRRNILGNHD